VYRAYEFLSDSPEDGNKINEGTMNAIFRFNATIPYGKKAGRGSPFWTQ